MSRVVLGFLTASFLLVQAPLAQAQTKVGYVDLQRALNEVADGRAAKAKLKKEFDVRQKELDDKQEELKKMQADIQAKADVMSEDARRKAQADMDQKLMAVSKLYATLQKELQQKEHDATKGIFARMSSIIKNIAEAENVSMVFEKTDSGLLFALPSLDLTNELIRRYNSQAAKDPTGSAAAPSATP
jgi:outer membrane protein